MQMSETSELGPNHSRASARAVGISRRSPFRSVSVSSGLLLVYPRVLAPPPGLKDLYSRLLRSGLLMDYSLMGSEHGNHRVKIKKSGS